MLILINMNRRHLKGFTIVEIIVVVTVLAVLAITATVAYVGMQRRSSDASVMRTIADAQKVLQTFQVFNHYYPANIANTDYLPPVTVAVVLYTNAPQSPVYANLSSAQNAQLFLNACNGFMPVVDGGTTYNTACVYSGNNVHVKGTVASNVVLHGPTINQADFALTCGSACTTAQNNIIATFLAQGGSFPITVTGSGSVLPSPTMVTTGNASSYCLEGRSPNFSDIIYHTTPDSASMPELGPCPANPSLHYP